jgi:TetR/AcrR family transcriptional regulator, mexJK operon transcriptional repressor
MELLDPGECTAAKSVPAKKLAVLKAALRLFLEQGFGATSMDAIAREAGVSKATLYAHVKSKEELFSAITATCAEQILAAQSAFDDETDIRAALTRFARGHVGLLLSPEGAAMYRIVIAEAPRFPELGRAFYENGPAIRLRALTDYLQRADANGALKVDNPSRAASEFVGMLGGSIHLRVMLGHADEVSVAEQEELVTHAVEAFLRAYRRD